MKKHTHKVLTNQTIVLYAERGKKFARRFVTRRGGRHEAENNMMRFLSFYCNNEKLFLAVWLDYAEPLIH